MVTKKPQKTPKLFLCDICDFVSKNKKDYVRHLSTPKHQMVTNGNKKPQKTPEHICNFCQNKYKFKSGLSRHIKKCLVENNLLLKYQTELLDKNNKLLEAMSQDKTENTTNITNNITIQMYLDNNCQSAISIDKFMENLKVTLGDLTKTHEVGYITGISNIIIKKLNDMDITKRPIHRDQSNNSNFYIKTNSNWETDDGDTVTKVIETSKKKHFELISEWMEENPFWDSSDEKTEECMNMIKQFTSKQKEEDEKILENIGNAVRLTLS